MVGSSPAPGGLRLVPSPKGSPNRPGLHAYQQVYVTFSWSLTPAAVHQRESIKLYTFEKKRKKTTKIQQSPDILAYINVFQD